MKECCFSKLQTNSVECVCVFAVILSRGGGNKRMSEDYDDDGVQVMSQMFWSCPHALRLTKWNQSKPTDRPSSCQCSAVLITV